MKTENPNPAQRLLGYIGEIDESFVEEAEIMVFTPKKKTSKKKYGTLVAGLSGLAAAAYFISRSRNRKTMLTAIEEALT